MTPVIYYLKNKLTWMASKLRWINKDEEIMSWIAAMEAVHKLLVEASMRREMWTRPQTKIRRRKTGLKSKGPAEGIDQLSRPVSCNMADQGFRKEKWQTETSKTETDRDEVKKIARRHEQTVPSIENPAGNIEDSSKKKSKSRPTRSVVRGVRVIRKGHKDFGLVKGRVLESSKENKAAQDETMELEGDVSKLDKESQLRRKLKVKDWWKRALWRKLSKWNKPWKTRTWGDYKRFIQQMFINGDYENMKKKMMEDLFDEFTAKAVSLVMSREELEDYLIDVKFRDFIGGT